MKIRHKLTLYFSLASAVIILIFGTSVFYFSAEYRKNEFFQRLLARIEIAEKVFLERDAFSDQDYEKIREQFLHSLPAETEEVIELTNNWKTQLKYPYPDFFLQNLEANEEAFFTNDTLQGAARIFHLPQGNFAVIITAADKVGMRVLANLRTIIVLAMSCCIAAMSILSHYISQSLIWPISRKIHKANTISVKNLHERLNVFNPDDELGELAVSFNNLLDRLEGAFTMQKLFVANASHEIRNPLTAILGEAEVALELERAPAYYRESLKNIAQEADRLNLLVNNLLQLSTVTYTPDIKREDIAVVRLLSDSKNKFDLLNPDNQIKFNLDHSIVEDVVVYGNNNLLQTALINIFDNASKFSADAEAFVTVKVMDDTVVISVRDQGVGIAPEDIPKINQPFFRAENVRQIRGTGIGIPLTLRIIEMHEGKLEVESELNKGTTVNIILPLVLSP
jgi:signal transduction histidine kinase